MRLGLTVHCVCQNLSSSLERSRAAMAEDLAKLSAQNEALSQQVETIPSLQQQLEVCTYIIAILLHSRP